MRKPMELTLFGINAPHSNSRLYGNRRHVGRGPTTDVCALNYANFKYRNVTANPSLVEQVPLCSITDEQEGTSCCPENQVWAALRRSVNLVSSHNYFHRYYFYANTSTLCPLSMAPMPSANRTAFTPALGNLSPAVLVYHSRFAQCVKSLIDKEEPATLLG
jgi:hypothetical protein